MTQCKFCNRDTAVEKTEKMPFNYNGKLIEYTDYFTCCRQCGEEYTTYEQATKGDNSLKEAKRQADGLLSPDEIKALRKAFALTQAQAAQVFGGGKNAFAKYERGEVRQSVAMDKLLRVVQKHPELINELSTH